MFSYKTQKKIVDILLSSLICIICFFPLLLAFSVATLETKSFGIFVQKRVGLHGRIFNLYKLKTMYDSDDSSTCTAANDQRITKFGRVFRRLKIDEIPQIFNVLKGDMSLVGPRPDVPFFTNTLTDKQLMILNVKPGITGPASLIFRKEELILTGVSDPVMYSLTVLWPQKVSINLKYIVKQSIYHDLKLIAKTVCYPLFPGLLSEYAKLSTNSPMHS